MTKRGSSFDAFQDVEIIDGVPVARMWYGWSGKNIFYTQEQVEERLNWIIKKLRSGISDTSLIMKLQHDVREYAQALRHLKQKQLVKATS